MTQHATPEKPQIFTRRENKLKPNASFILTILINENYLELPTGKLS